MVLSVQALVAPAALPGLVAVMGLVVAAALAASTAAPIMVQLRKAQAETLAAVAVVVASEAVQGVVVALSASFLVVRNTRPPQQKTPMKQLSQQQALAHGLSPLVSRL